MKLSNLNIVYLAIAGLTPLPLFAQATLPAVTDTEKSVTSRVESIRAAYRQGRDSDVILMVDETFLEVTKTGDHSLDAELYFWKGSSYRRLGKIEQALIAFKQAKALGYRGPELFLESGLANRAVGNTQEADQDYQEGRRILPDDLEQRQKYNERWAKEGKEKTRFQLNVAPNVGYDSNVVGLDKNTPLFDSNLKNFDSYYVGLNLSARYYLIRNEHQILQLEYQAQGRDFPNANDVSYIDNIGSLTGRQPLTDWVDLEARAALEEAFVRQDGHFRTERILGPALIMQPTYNLQVRLWGDYTNVAYYAASTAEQDRDGDIVRVGLTLAMDLSNGWNVAPYVFVDKYNADGSDYKSQGWEFGVTVLPPEVAGFKFTFTASYGQQDYKNPNSVTNFTEKRKDKPFGFILAVTFRQLESVIGYAPTLSVSYYDHRSNIHEFSYSRWAPQIELGITALSF